MVDEVLAVGDAEFQKKAIGKMQDVSKGEGRTVLFVSHNMGSIRKLCNSGILLNNGKLEISSDIESVISKYTSNFDTSNLSNHWELDTQKKACITDIRVYTLKENHPKIIDIHDEIQIEISYYLSEDIKGSNLCFSLYKEGTTLIRSFDIDENSKIFQHRQKGKHIAKLTIPNFLTPGIYNTSISIGQPKITIFDVKKDALQFEVKNHSENECQKSFSRGGIINATLAWSDALE